MIKVFWFFFTKKNSPSFLKKKKQKTFAYFPRRGGRRVPM